MCDSTCRRQLAVVGHDYPSKRLHSAAAERAFLKALRSARLDLLWWQQHDAVFVPGCTSAAPIGQVPRARGAWGHRRSLFAELAFWRVPCFYDPVETLNKGSARPQPMDPLPDLVSRISKAAKGLEATFQVGGSVDLQKPVRVVWEGRSGEYAGIEFPGDQLKDHIQLCSIAMKTWPDYERRASLTIDESWLLSYLIATSSLAACQASLQELRSACSEAVFGKGNKEVGSLKAQAPLENLPKHACRGKIVYASYIR